ncbi:hypothetical protein SPLC1_S200160 [Arthrospira platensis C1]|nr:hypothetical protein SPLC1_S200160 [Arthrospira platensis C1]
MTGKSSPKALPDNLPQMEPLQGVQPTLAKRYKKHPPRRVI